MNRAYSFLEVKAVGEETRTITGWATTPETDRTGDIVEPLGVKYKNPLVLLWQHDHEKPIGTVDFGTPTAKGVPFTATIAKVEEPGTLKDRVDEAWQSVKAGLIRAVSIGFRSLDHEEIKGTYGLRYKQTEVYELSLVSVPACAGAVITGVKSLKSYDVGLPAASGKKEFTVVKLAKPAGASATVKKKIPVVPKPEEGQDMNIAEQIKSFQAAMEQKSARQTELMTSAEGRTLDAAESEEFDTLTDEIAATETHLKRLEAMQKAAISTAKPVVDASGMQDRSKSHSAAIVRSVKNEEPGIGFAKFALAMYAGKGDVSSAKAFAENQFPNDVRLQGIMKAAVAAGTTTNPTWAGNLVDYQNLSSEFIEFLRPRTIVGQFGTNGIPSLRRIPFNVRIPGKSASGTAAWVSEGFAKPVTSSAYDARELKWAKIAAISVITEELARFSDPSIQALVRDDLAEAVIERMDVDFINPAKAAGTGASVSPASVTNGVTPIASTGTDADSIRADIAALWAQADSTNLPAASAVYITDAKTARQLSLLRNPLGSVEFPGVTMTGGNLDGIPVIISNYVPSDSGGSLFILAFASEIYLADDGVVTVDISREASILMDSAPNMNSGTPTGSAQLVSMFQTNSLACRAERYVNWAKRRPQAVAYLDNVNWGA
jgi:HK97 family phage major capsid protein/HK97 family phage prohead protease